MSEFAIIVAGTLAVVERGDGTYDVNAGYWRLERDEGTHVLEDQFGDAHEVARTTSIEFEGEPWQEGLTAEQLDELRVGGFSIAQLQGHAT